jgi:hypothetical protein
MVIWMMIWMKLSMKLSIEYMNGRRERARHYVGAAAFSDAMDNG